MAWVIERKGPKGTSFMGCYRDPDGSQRSAGAFPTRRAALRAAHREEDKVGDGRWHDASLGKVTFRDYVETDWLPSRAHRGLDPGRLRLLPRQALLPILR